MFSKENKTQPYDNSSYLVKREALFFHLPKLHLDQPSTKLKHGHLAGNGALTPRSLNKQDHIYDSLIQRDNLNVTKQTLYNEVQELQSSSKSGGFQADRLVPPSFRDSLNKNHYLASRDRDSLQKTLEFSCDPFTRKNCLSPFYNGESKSAPTNKQTISWNLLKYESSNGTKSASSKSAVSSKTSATR